ncbi:MAG: hypothetical protein COB19_06625 [Porticoccus sp.]|nr:MAG: hypothetical protein COB19_06625 [Porticoccus sp.]
MSPKPRHFAHLLQTTILVCIAYYVLGRLGFLLAIPPGNITLFWLPSGLAAATILARGTPAAIGVFLGAAAVNLSVIDSMSVNWPPLVISLIIAAGSTAQGYLLAYLFRRFLRLGSSAKRFELLIKFCGLAMLGSVVAATVGSITMMLSSAFPQDGLLTWLTWWVGDLLGILILTPPLVVWLDKQHFRRLPNVDLLVILSGGVGLSVLLFVLSIDLLLKQIHGEFNHEAERFFLNVTSALNQVFQRQEQIAVYFETAGEMSRKDFHILVEKALSGPYKTPGLYGISWNPHIYHAQRNRYENRAREDGFEAFSVTELGSGGQLQAAAERDEYVFVYYLAPHDKNIGALGYDILSDPVRRAAILAARDSGEPKLTSPIALVQTRQTKDPYGALLLWPVYSLDNQSGDDGWMGLVVGVLYYRSLIESLLPTSMGNRIEVNLWDKTATDNGVGTLLFSSGENVASPNILTEWFLRAMSSVQSLDIGGRTLTVQIQPTKAFAEAKSIIMPFAILLAGLIITLLALLIQRQRVDIINARRLQDYKISEVLDTARDAVIEIDTSSRVTGWNSAAESIFLIKAEDALGKNLADLIIPPGNRAAHHDGMQRFLQSGRSEVVNQISELQAIRGNGSLFPVELTTRYIEHPDGNRFVGLVRDLTRRKQTEARLLEMEKVESMGQLTAGLAHDFNNLLGVVIGNLEMLDKELLVGESKENLQHAMDAAIRASEVTRSLMAIARREPMELAVYDMNELMVGLKQLVHSTIGSLAEVRWQLSHEPLMVKVDPGSFSSAVLNLVLNARDAMRNCSNKKITLSTDGVELNAHQFSDLVPGKFARLKVGDTGKGMDSDTKLHALEPFYTTKERGHGTGLGLPMVYGFARQLKGSLELETAKGRGTVVSIYLPCVEQTVKSLTPVHRDISAPLLGAGVVLVVDDEVLLCRLACRIFESLGYRAIPAVSALEAMNVLEKQAIDLVFSDISMPGGMNGIELAEHVVECYPQTPVILTSGYSEELVERNANQWIVVQKPYLKNDIVEALFKVTLVL